MEIAYIGPASVRIKGKQAILTTNVLDGKGKIAADANLLTGVNKTTEFLSPNVGIVFQSAGEYEIKGTKITGFSVGEDVMYTVAVDGLSVYIGNITSSEKAKEKLHEHDVAVFIADDILSQTTLGVLNASVVLFVGEKADENAKAFGKAFAKMSKYTTTKEKLPQEAELIFLG